MAISMGMSSTPAATALLGHIDLPVNDFGLLAASIPILRQFSCGNPGLAAMRARRLFSRRVAGERASSNDWNGRLQLSVRATLCGVHHDYERWDFE
jgi:hypothetical protein